MSKLISIWNFICRRKYLITIVAFAVIIGFLDENSLVRRLGYEREISQLKEEIEKRLPKWEAQTGLKCDSWQTKYMVTKWAPAARIKRNYGLICSLLRSRMLASIILFA